MINQLPDEEILRQSLADPACFAALVDKYQAAFLRKALTIVRNPADAEDITQETFIKIYKYGHNFEKKAGIEFKSWAYKILMNTAFTKYQDMKKRVVKEEYLDPIVHHAIAGQDGRDDALVGDAKEIVSATIAKMPENLGRLLKFYYLDDKSYKEICAIEDIPLTTLKMRLFRAKKLFHKLSAEI